MTFMQIVGVFDGVLLAAATALGQAYPPAQPYTAVAVMVLGVISSVIGKLGHDAAVKGAK